MRRNRHTFLLLVREKQAILLAAVVEASCFLRVGGSRVPSAPFNDNHIANVLSLPHTAIANVRDVGDLRRKRPMDLRPDLHKVSA